MFRYAVSNWIYGNEGLEQIYRRLTSKVFDAVELLGEPERYPPEKVTALNREYGLGVALILSWCILPLPGRDLAHPATAEREEAVKYVCRNVDLAVEVGTPQVVVIPAPR